MDSEDTDTSQEFSQNKIFEMFINNTFPIQT